MSSQIESIADYLKELNKSDIDSYPRPKTLRTQLYREHLLSLKSRLGEGSATVRMPTLKGRYDRAWPGHFHANPEVFMQISGATNFLCPGGQFDLKAGELCVMPSGVPHYETDRSAPSEPYLTLIMMVWGSGVSLHFGFVNKEGQTFCKTFDRYSGESRGPVTQLIELLGAHGLNPDDYGEYCLHLIHALLDRIINSTEHPFDAEDDTNSLVHQCRHQITMHQDEVGFNVQKLATLLGYHPDYLSRLFQVETGQTIIRHLNEQRIHRAKYHLTGPLTINEVAWSCGFAHTSYFIKVFKEHTGMTPKEYRVSKA